MLNHHYFCKYGPLAATCLTVFWMHVFFIFDADTFANLNLKLLLLMLLLMILGTIIGYIIGIIPALITESLFFKFLQHSKWVLTQQTILKYGLSAGLGWLAPSLLIFLIDIPLAIFALGFTLLVILPTSMFCANLEWKRYQQSLALGL